MKQVKMSWGKCLKGCLIFMVVSIWSLSLQAEDGLIGSWRFDEGSGTVAADDSGNGNDGTLYNMSTPWITGRYNYALNFDGSDDYVDCGNDSIFNVSATNAFTISCWIRPNDLSSEQGIIGKMVGGSWATATYAITITSNGYVKITVGNGSSYSTVSLPASCFSVGEWVHIAATYDGHDLRGYVNGEEKASNEDIDYTLASNAASLKIGQVYYYFDGDIDEVRLYNQALNASEIMTVFDDLRGQWLLDDGSGTTIADSSGHDITGTLVNMDYLAWVSGHLNEDGYFRTALHFDGSNDYVDCGNDSLFDVADTNEFTISCWIKFDDLSRENGIIGKMVGGSWATATYAITTTSNGYVKITIGNGSAYRAIYLPAACFEEGVWTHIAATYDGNNLRGYVNGEEEASAENVGYTLNTNTASLKIGQVYYYLEGSIDKIHIYGRALSEAEIKAKTYWPALAALPDRNYYTGENAVAISSLNVTSDAGLSGCYLVAKDSQGNTLGTNNYPGQNTDLTYATSSLANGSNTITVEFRESSGELFLATSFDIMKRAANPGYETKIDLRNGIVLRDGDPFFPIGLYVNGIDSSSSTDFQAISTAGFNSIIHWESYNLSPSYSTEYLEAADDCDLLVVEKLQSYSSVNLADYRDSEEDFLDAYIDERDQILDMASYAKQEENLLAYYTFDEPNANMLDAGQNLYAGTNSEDGYHPTFVLYMMGYGLEGENYINWCDIFGTDPYWVPPRVIGVNNGVNRVAKYTCIYRERAKQNRKVLWIAPVAEYYGSTYKRALLPEEQRCQTYLALIHGAKGIFYFRYPICHKDNWDMLSSLASEVASLSPSLLNPDLSQTITYYNESAPVEFDPENDIFTDVQVRLFEAPSGENYDYILLAANTREYPVDVDFTVSLLGSSGTVDRLFSQENCSVTDSKFSDEIESFGTRAYTFSSASTDPITIGVDMSPDGTYSNEEVIPVSGRENCTNLMQNPSFENDTLENWPDYIKPLNDVDQSNRICSANQNWGLVTDSPYHGSKCLKIAKRPGYTSGYYFKLLPEVSGNYTLSMYLRTDAAGAAANSGSGLRIQLNNGSSNTGIIYLNSTAWVRREITGSGVGGSLYLFDNGNIWVDAIQMESGSSATPFTMD